MVDVVMMIRVWNPGVGRIETLQIHRASVTVFAGRKFGLIQYIHGLVDQGIRDHPSIKLCMVLADTVSNGEGSTYNGRFICLEIGIQGDWTPDKCRDSSLPQKPCHVTVQLVRMRDLRERDCSHGGCRWE